MSAEYTPVAGAVTEEAAAEGLNAALVSKDYVEMQEQPGGRTSVWNSIPLHVYRWTPTSDIKGLLYISHGVGEYMGRFEQLGQALVNKGILTFGHDHVGHGQSGGDRVHVNTFDTYVKDLINHVKDMKAEHPGIPTYLMGHSMGSLIAILAAAKEKDLFEKVILSAASVEINPIFSGPVIEFLVKLLAYLVPQCGVTTIDSNQISSLEEEVQQYINDPLIHHGKLKAKWAHENFEAMKIARAKVREIVIPALLIHGEDDQIVPVSASEFIYDEIGSTEKTFKRYPGNRHEVLHDQSQDQAQTEIEDFLTGAGVGHEESGQ